eukprot:s2058_g2.t1
MYNNEVGPQRWNEILTLSRLSAFSGFESFVPVNLEEFKAIYDSVEAEKESLPEPWESKLTPMQRLCHAATFLEMWSLACRHGIWENLRCSSIAVARALPYARMSLVQDLVTVRCGWREALRHRGVAVLEGVLPQVELKATLEDIWSWLEGVGSGGAKLLQTELSFRSEIWQICLVGPWNAHVFADRTDREPATAWINPSKHFCRLGFQIRFIHLDNGRQSMAEGQHVHWYRLCARCWAVSRSMEGPRACCCAGGLCVLLGRGALQAADVHGCPAACAKALHADQNVYRRPELQAIQGLLTITAADPQQTGGFVCVPGSHLPEAQQELCDLLGGPRLRKRGDFLALPEGAALGTGALGVSLRPGDLLLWDARLLHGSEPAPGVEAEGQEAAQPTPPELLRVAVPVCMVPRSFAEDEEQLAAWRQKAVAQGITTKHWPHRQRAFCLWELRAAKAARASFIRSFRIDCLKNAVIEFISKEIGSKFVDPPTFDIAKSYADSVSTTPLIFILSPGTDPVADVIRFAEQLGMSKKFEPISLGQGQGPKAQRMIDSARQSGGWVLLSNCHLMQSWMSTLEAIAAVLHFQAFDSTSGRWPDLRWPTGGAARSGQQSELCGCRASLIWSRLCLVLETMSNNFRLWLTSMPAKTFPVQVLQNGIKMTNEPPSGLRANLLRSYSSVTDRLFEESDKPGVFKTLLFGFCFFHAVVQDRRKFGPIGWNIPYGFTPEDLAVCRQQLMLFVNKYKDVPYKVLNFLGAQINYGGRVTDDKDKLLISTILATYICPEAVNGMDQYKYSASGLYYAPPSETVEDFIEYIRSLPLYPMPEAFGLHDNCNITCAQDEAFKLLVGMQSMVSAGGGGGDGKSADDVMDATAASIQDKLPKPFPLDVCEQKFPTRYEESMNTVVKQECLRYNKLLTTMDSSLKAFRKAIKGLIVMTAELEEVGKQLFINEVPEMWSKKGPLSLKPLSSWFPDILARVAFFQNWNDLGRTPPVHWISGIFFPQAFFTGAMQNYARKHGEEIDLLSFSQKVMDNIVNPKRELIVAPEDGVYIYGLFMEGARWDNDTHMVQESQPKVLFTELPSLWFLPVKDRKPNAKDYRCPTYKVLSRKGTLLTTGHSTNFVLYLELPTDQAVSKWIKAGVASFLALKH